MAASEDGPRWWSPPTRVAVLLMLTLATFIHTECRLRSDPDLPPPQARPPEIQKAVVDTYSKQSDTLMNWSLALLGALVAVSITTKVHRVRWCSTTFILLGPAGVLFFGSLRAGWEFQGRVSNMIAKGDLSDLQGLAWPLLQQIDMFAYGLVLSAAFGAWFLLNIVFGATYPYDISPDKR